MRRSMVWFLGSMMTGGAGAAAPVEILDTRHSYTAPLAVAEPTLFESATPLQSTDFEGPTDPPAAPADLGIVMIQNEGAAFVPQPMPVGETPTVIEQASSVSLEEVPQELARLTSRVEELEQKIVAMDQTLQAQAKLLAHGTTPLRPAPSSVDPATSLSPERTPMDVEPQLLGEEKHHLSPEAAYEAARAYITQADYPRARRALEAFVKSFPDHALVGAALYWVGETFFVEKDYKGAAQKFLEAYKHNPKGSKSADSLLKLALCLEQLGKIPEACTTLKKLFKEYPHMNGSIKAMAQRSRDRLKCKK